MKKNILAIAAGIMIAGVVTIVACSKDNETKQSVNPTFSSTKGGSTLNQLRNVMVAYYAACDSAYQADSTTFLSICANNDTTNFYKVTGLSSEMLMVYRAIILQELEECLYNNPNFKPDGNDCLTCYDSALVKIGRIEHATKGQMAYAITSNDLIDMQSLLDTLVYCHQNSTTKKITSCISATMGERFALAEIVRKLDTAICDINHACNVAYKNDSILLMKICDDNDFDAFYSFIGVSNTQLKDIFDLSMSGLELFTAAHPNHQFTLPSCKPCDEFALSIIADQLWRTHGFLPAAYGYYDHLTDWECQKRCSKDQGSMELHYSSFDACLRACLNEIWLNNYDK